MRARFAAATLICVGIASALVVADLGAKSSPLPFSDVPVLCCVCTGGAAGPRSVTPTVNQSVVAGMSPCDIACASAFQGGVAKTGDQHASWMLPAGSQCGQNPPPPLTATPVTVRESVRYAVGHQGAGAWQGTTDDLLAVADLRKSLTNVDMDTTALTQASDAMLIQGAKEGLAECTGSRDIRPDFYWVCTHQGQGRNIHRLYSAGDYNGIRSTFSNAEAHDDQLRNLAYCRKGSEINDLVTNYCPVTRTSIFGLPIAGLSDTGVSPALVVVGMITLALAIFAVGFVFGKRGRR